MLTLHASDATGQKAVDVVDVPPDATVGEMINGLLPRLDLPQTNLEGAPLSYQARLEREGRHLHQSERVGDALKPGDEISLHPNIDAGAGS